MLIGAVSAKTLMAYRRRLRRWPVRDHLPVGRSEDRHRVRGLQVGLIEAREHTLGIGGLELRIQVHGVVGGVDEAMQSSPVLE